MSNLERSERSEQMLNFFVNLVNTIGVPVLLVGTDGARAGHQSTLSTNPEVAQVAYIPPPQDIELLSALLEDDEQDEGEQNRAG